MTNSSYYDDIALVVKTLERTSRFKEENELLYEVFNNVENISNEFSEVVKNLSPTDQEFATRYQQLSSSYLALESAMSRHDSECRVAHGERQRVKKLSYLLLDKRTSLLRPKVFVETSGISPEFVHVVRTLWKDSLTIGFTLDIEEKNVISTIEECISSV